MPTCFCSVKNCSIFVNPFSCISVFSLVSSDNFSSCCCLIFCSSSCSVCKRYFDEAIALYMLCIELYNIHATHIVATAFISHHTVHYSFRTTTPFISLQTTHSFHTMHVILHHSILWYQVFTCKISKVFDSCSNCSCRDFLSERTSNFSRLSLSTTSLAEIKAESTSRFLVCSLAWYWSMISS